ncbi:hypothetical protein Cni_G00129 [Canna indica]|uniref:TOD1/MUCI70 glycosyltransferase-like domain-containing protein n=1 Tax=Canna indica TaxID=4628 RepID=A0AAQ3JLT5_9LILI|nr:hypothetical protein Cni_G00129 [Canna indica]
MTGAPLGLRSGSYGSSLQQLQSGAVLPTHSQPVVLRKSSRSFSGSREKERILSRICKFVGRRKLGMMLLLMTLAAVLSFASVVSKDEDSLGGPNIRMVSTDQDWDFVNPGRPLNTSRPPFILAKGNKDVVTLGSNQESASNHNITQNSVPVLHPTPHPCESFPLPSPPADKRHTGPRPCPVCYVPVEKALLLMPHSPSESPVLKNLSYFSEDNLIANESNGGSIFGGHPSLQQRNESFNIKESMTVHCGFFNGLKSGRETGFHIDEDVLSEMEACNDVVVASAIFGNYDVMQQPKNISEYAKKNACFYMFIDEETETYMKNSSSLDDIRRVGLWRVVVVQNLPYEDSRRNGKVPKLLLHRLFPNARYSLWIDGKLELVVDPYQVLERFLWRKNYSFAISRHYRRFDVFEEAEANKAAGKYDNASIDSQIEFYKKEGLTHYSLSKLPITSDVPEGCVIIKEHTPITNLFTCLWFNEVDHFTARDQISFSTVRDKIMSQVNWTINMFMDCERRNFVVQAYHRDLLEQRKALAEQLKALATIHPPPAPVNNVRIARAPPSKKVNIRHGRDKRSGSRRHHPKASIGQR